MGCVSCMFDMNMVPEAIGKQLEPMQLYHVLLSTLTASPPIALGTLPPVKPMENSMSCRPPSFRTCSNTIKLRKLQLHPFGGELMKWMAFLELLESTIHNTLNLPMWTTLTTSNPFLWGQHEKL